MGAKSNNMKYKIGQRVIINRDLTSVSGCIIDGKCRHGAKVGDIVIITGITPKHGHATESDPRYYGDNFNHRAEDLKLIEEETINTYDLY